MENCIFCKIAKREIDSAKFWENEKFFALLDIFPNTKGMTLVLTKKHYDSYVFDMSDEMYTEFMQVGKTVSKLLERGLEIQRVVLVAEGMGINHAHLKLYPLHGIQEKFKEMWGKEKIFFETYEGYISTQLGPAADMKDLKKLAEEIKNKNQ